LLSGKLWKRIRKYFRCCIILPWAKSKLTRIEKQGRQKQRCVFFVGVSRIIFTRIMTFKSAKEIWDFLKERYAGNQRTQNMLVLNLVREFELQRMKFFETIKKY